MVQWQNLVSPNLAFQMTNAEQGESITFSICYPLGTTITSVSRGFGGILGQSPIPNYANSIAIPADGNRKSADVLGGNKYNWDAARGLLTFTVRQRNVRSNYGNFCPNNGCDFVWVKANVPAGARDCTNAAYSGDSLQETNSNWYNMQLTPV